jgi:hemolysin III
LRRFDHSAIFVLIAATYTPFILDARNSALAAWHLAGIWSAAALGILLKLRWPGRFDRASIGLYLAMGWSGAALFRPEAIVVPGPALSLVATGGMLFSFGLIFHLWERLRFQNAIWHCFVLVGAACHYAAVFNLVLG